MAKEQNLSLNPTKISGICGRLLCCLKYESEGYGMEGLDVPEVGSMVMTTEGEGKVTHLNTNKGFTRVRLTESGKTMEFPLDEIDLIKTQKPACGCGDGCGEGCGCSKDQPEQTNENESTDEDETIPEKQ